MKIQFFSIVLGLVCCSVACTSAPSRQTVQGNAASSGSGGTDLGAAGAGGNAGVSAGGSAESGGTGGVFEPPTSGGAGSTGSPDDAGAAPPPPEELPPPCVGRAELPERPHVVIFIADDHSQSDAAPYGNEHVDTPTMQELSEQGLRFDRAYVGSPSCAPSRAILLTGLMSVSNGAEPNHSQPHPELTKLPAYMQAEGYTVAAFGKVSHGGSEQNYGFDAQGSAVLDAVEYIEGFNPDERLLLFAGSRDPHVPWPQNRYPGAEVELPETSLDDANGVTREQRRYYYTDINNVDQQLRQVYDAARAKFGDNLLFIYTADHGSQWPFAKWNLYEAGIRVPMLAVWPGVLEPGRSTEAMVSWLDLLPTLIELSGGAPPQTLEGASFLPLLRCESSAHHEEIYATHTGDAVGVYPMRTVVTATHKYIRNLHPEFKFITHLDQNTHLPHNSFWLEWMADDSPEAVATVSRYHARPAQELYDLEADPNEMHNLADDPAYAAILGQLSARIDAWMSAQGDMGTIHMDPTLLEND